MEKPISADDQVKVSRWQSAIAHLSAIRDQLSSMLELAAQEGADSTSDAAFQLFKQDILGRINGGASFGGIPLFITDQSIVSLCISAGVESPEFASWVWGADNDRFREDVSQFRPLTADERAFRAANRLSHSESVPQTHAEKKARRLRNIFDTEYGHIRSAERSQVMIVQLENAIKQIITLITRFDTRATNILSQSRDKPKRPNVQEVMDSLTAAGKDDSLELAVAKLQQLRDGHLLAVGEEL